LRGQLGVNARRAVGCARAFMNRLDTQAQFPIGTRSLRARPYTPRIVAAGGDSQHPAHRGNPVHGLIRTHELERRDGTEPVSVANQAAAFDKISRSSRSTRFSRLSRVSSSRSLLVSPSLRSPVSSCACLTHCRMLSTDGSNSRANSFSDRPARASSTIRRRYSAGYGGCVFGIALLLAFLPNTLHETGSTPKNRTALCNQLRGLLRERGVAVRAGVAALKRGLPAALADESSELSGEMRELLCEMSQWLRTLEQRIASCEARITRKFKHDERCQ